MNTLSETRVSGVPGREGVGGICACTNRVEMSRNYKNKTANFFQVEAGHLSVLEYKEGG